MTETALLLAALAALAFAAFSRKLAASMVTGPMIFLGLGWALSGTAMLEHVAAEHWLHLLAEVTLVIVLFADATRINPRHLATQHRWPLRMLLIGLPLAILFGTGLGALLLPGWGFWEIALLAAILAPTDAALGQAVVSNTSVPERIRRTLSVESGLNDGLALPLVLLFGCIAVGGVHDFQQVSWIAFAGQQIGLGLLAGVMAGLGGGALLKVAHTRGLSEGALEGIGILALAGLAYLLADALGGNGFLAAFAGGLAYRYIQGEPTPYLDEFMETEGTLLVLMTFLLVGLVLIDGAIANLDPAVLLLITGSLFIVRPAAIWLSLAGTDAPPRTRLFLGWFGPRGLATVLFALLIVSRLEAALHGLSAAPAAKRYGPNLG